MFEREISRTDWMVMMGISVAMMVPFFFMMRDMSESLRMIAEKR